MLRPFCLSNSAKILTPDWLVSLPKKFILAIMMPPVKTMKRWLEVITGFSLIKILLYSGRLAAKIGKIVTKLTKSVFLFPATPKDNWNVFGGIMKKLFILYLIIVFNNVLGYSVSKTWTWQLQQIHGHENFLFDVFELNIDWQRKIANR